MRYTISIRGLVQGVGFRPMVYRCAREACVNGTVENSNDGVTVEVDADGEQVRQFMQKIRQSAPPMAEISEMRCEETEDERRWNAFEIVPSRATDGFTQVSADIAVCEDCLRDIERQEHRMRYAFVNCTHCGPRFTIIKSQPYDRRMTTMAPFEMCEQCKSEYENPLDRRFHAQPTGCNRCGVHYRLDDIDDYEEIVKEVVRRLERGEIVAVKSMGGYNMMCDAENESAVNELRRLKHRPRKPLAVMMADLDVVRKMCETSEKDEATLTGWRRPIVILQKKKSALARNVADGYASIGVMLPYMVIHYDIFKLSRLTALVVTSGNDVGRPIICDDDEARKTLGERMNIAVVSYNREIWNRIDDSVVKQIDGEMRVMRRARGFVPQPQRMPISVEGILAMGADMIGQFMIGRGESAIGSQYIGSLDSVWNEMYMDEMIRHFSELYSFRPRIVAVDAHPNYLSSQKGERLAAERGVEVVKVWHHHAHACAVMAEYGIEGEVMALVLDGTGLGKDGSVWGGELLKCDEYGFERLWHLPVMQMAGGDAASREPWRMAVSMVLGVDGNLNRLPEHIVAEVGEARVRMVSEMLERNVNVWPTTGAGRLWDAVAALLGICYRNSYEGECAMLLEQFADACERSGYSIGLDDYSALLDAVLTDVKRDVGTERIAARFHNGVADALVDEVFRQSEMTGLRRVVMCGGVMQNKILVERMGERLRRAGLQVFVPKAFPAGDGGIALGQLYVAAKNFIKRKRYA